MSSRDGKRPDGVAVVMEPGGSHQTADTETPLAGWKGNYLRLRGTALRFRRGAFCGVSDGHETSPRLLGLLDRRHAEEPLELPAELRRALIPDRPRRGARVVAVVGHEPPCVVEPDSLEV